MMTTVIRLDGARWLPAARTCQASRRGHLASPVLAATSSQAPTGAAAALPRAGGRCVIKICGITSPEDAAAAAAAGADFVGLIMWPKAKRSVPPSTARDIVAAARQHGAQPVGVFVDESAEEIQERCEAVGLGIAQLHGDGARAALGGLQGRPLSTIYVLNAVPETGEILTPLPPPGSVDWVLIDGLKVSNVSRPSARQGPQAAAAAEPPLSVARRGWLLAGGLKPDNVGEAILASQPGGVDTSSGVCGPDVDRLLMAMLDMSSFKAEQLELDAALVAVESMQQQAPQQGQAESSGGATRLASLRPTSTDSKEEVLRFLGRALVLPVVDGRYRAPVVTLHNSDTSNLYSLLERQLRTEYLVGAEKFWKIVRLDQHLDTWRPRVHGTQLKALLNCRLPEMPEEYVSAEKSIHSVKWALRPDTSPENFVAELRKFVAGVEVWWDHRNSRRPPADGGGASGGSKRSAPAALAAPPAKQQQVSSQPLQMQLPSPGGALPSSGPALRKSGNAAARQSQQEALVSSSPMYAHQNNLMRMHASYSENGLGGSRDSPDDLPFAGNGGPELQQLLPPGRGGQVPGIPVPSPSEPGAIIQLNVGGTPYATTVGTLTCVHGSLFWDLLNPASSGLHDPPRTALGELFLDRNGKVFTYILEYLRATANKEPYSPLPEDAQAMMALAREAEYYGLPGLVDRIRNTAIMPQAGTAAVYDSIYLETGFASIEGPSLKEMEQRKVVVMQQMNHVLAQKALDGFYVAACDCGVNHRDGPDGMQHNLFYHILLKKVMAPVHGLGSSGLVHHSQVAAAMQQHAAMAMGQVVQGMPGGLPMPMGVPMHGGPGGRR